MTTIAYKDGVMAADTQGNWNGDVSYHYNKLARTNNYLIGFTGTFVSWIPLYEWILEKDTAGIDPFYFWRDTKSLVNVEENAAAIMVNKSGNIWSVYTNGGTAPLLGVYEAVGSGARFAIGAMCVGATAVQGVEAAIKHDDRTGGLVDVLTFDGPPRPPFFS